MKTEEKITVNNCLEKSFGIPPSGDLGQQARAWRVVREFLKQKGLKAGTHNTGLESAIAFLENQFQSAPLDEEGVERMAKEANSKRQYPFRGDSHELAYVEGYKAAQSHQMAKYTEEDMIRFAEFILTCSFKSDKRGYLAGKGDFRELLALYLQSKQPSPPQERSKE